MRVKYGQIGTTHAHASKMSVYRSSDDYEVVGVVEDDPAARARAEQSPTYKGLPFMTSEQLLNVPGLQVVGVETPVRDLLATAEMCIEAGKHVHIDKPAGSSLPHFRRVLDAAASKHLAVQLGYMFRYNPGVVLLRKFLKQGWLGEPFELHTTMGKISPSEARIAFAEFKGGAMFELGCHVIDLVVGLLGKPDKVHPFPRQSPASKEDGLYDNMLAVFEYPVTTATVRASVIEVEGTARRHLALCGTEGTFHIQPLDNPGAWIALSQPRGSFSRGVQEIELPKYTRYVGDAADLAAIVRGEKDTDFSYEHEYAVQEAVLLASAMPTA